MPALCLVRVTTSEVYFWSLSLVLPWFRPSLFMRTTVFTSKLISQAPVFFVHSLEWLNNPSTMCLRTSRSSQSVSLPLQGTLCSPVPLDALHPSHTTFAHFHCWEILPSTQPLSSSLECVHPLGHFPESVCYLTFPKISEIHILNIITLGCFCVHTRVFFGHLRVE